MRPRGKRPRGTRGSGSAVEREPGKLGSPCAVPLAGEELTHHSGAAAGDGVTLANLGSCQFVSTTPGTCAWML